MQSDTSYTILARPRRIRRHASPAVPLPTVQQLLRNWSVSPRPTAPDADAPAANGAAEEGTQPSEEGAPAEESPKPSSSSPPPQTGPEASLPSSPDAVATSRIQRALSERANLPFHRLTPWKTMAAEPARTGAGSGRPGNGPVVPPLDLHSARDGPRSRRSPNSSRKGDPRSTAANQRRSEDSAAGSPRGGALGPGSAAARGAASFPHAVYGDDGELSSRGNHEAQRGGRQSPHALARAPAGLADTQQDSFREAVMHRATERSARPKARSPRPSANDARRSPRPGAAVPAFAALGVVVANGGDTPLSVEFCRAREARLRSVSVAPNQVAPSAGEQGERRRTLVARLHSVPTRLPRSQPGHGPGSREPEPVLIKFCYPCGQSPVEVYWADFSGTPQLRERLLPTRVASSLELSHTAHCWLLHHVRSGRALLLRPGAQPGARSGIQERRSLITWFVGDNRLSLGERLLAASHRSEPKSHQHQEPAPGLVVTIMDS